MDKNKVYYFSDELNDEFSGVSRRIKIIPDNYKYIVKNPLWNAAAVIVHRIFVTPVAYIYLKAKFRLKIVNKAVLKENGKAGFFLFGNHTQVPGDGFLQAVVAFPKKSYAVVNSDNVAAHGTENLMKMIGAFPLPSGLKGYKNFQRSMEARLKSKAVVTIYPEAHIWPYYTKIRPFKSTAFKYPIKFDKPSFSFTATYSKRKNSDKANMTVYIDGPFYADKALPHSAQAEDLRNKVYQKMCERCRKHSTYEYVKYIRKDSNDND